MLTTALRKSNATYHSDIVSVYSNDKNSSAIYQANIDFTKPLIQSPLNYTGSKFRLLPQILPLFPKNISVMVDLFCGGASDNKVLVWLMNALCCEKTYGKGDRK